MDFSFFSSFYKIIFMSVLIKLIENIWESNMHTVLSCLRASYSMLEKNLELHFFVILYLVMFGTYCKSQQNSMATNFFYDES